MNSSMSVTIFLAFFLLGTIGSSGCLMQNKPDPSPTNIPTITTAPASSVQSGVRIFTSADSICIGDEISFGLVNEGNSKITFVKGYPFLVQVLNNRTWGNIYLGGGTQGFWSLNPGEKVEWSFPAHSGLYDYYSSGIQEFTIKPGLYRIKFGWRDPETKEIVELSTDFTINEC